MAAGSSPSSRDAEAIRLPVAAIAPARQPGLPGVPRGWTSAGVAPRFRGTKRAAGVLAGTGAGRRRRGRAAPVARPRRADAAPVARPRRGRVLRRLLLRVGHPLLP